jgi:hypothetical protein
MAQRQQVVGHLDLDKHQLEGAKPHLGLVEGMLPEEDRPLLGVGRTALLGAGRTVLVVVLEHMLAGEPTRY